jgi:hypothetical protein
VSRSKVWVPVLAGAAAVGALAYAFTRRTRAGSSVLPSAANDAQLPLRDSMVVSRGEALGPLGELDLDGVFDGDSDESLGLDEGPTAQSIPRVPALASADDAEAPSPDDLGAFWLQRAAQSEHSLSESELMVDIDELSLAAPGEEEDIDEGDRLSAEAWRG